MLAEWNRLITRVEERLEERERLEGRLSRARQVLSRERSRLRRLERASRREGADVARLEGMGLAALLLVIVGMRARRLEVERREHAAALGAASACRRAVRMLEREAGELEKRVAAVGDPREEHAALLASAAESERPVSDGARQAGREALAALERMAAALEDAAEWGRRDLWGGGLLVTVAKHARIAAAREEVPRVRETLRRFAGEAGGGDALACAALEVEVGAIETGADHVSDGLVADRVVQAGIERALEGIGRVRRTVSAVVER